MTQKIYLLEFSLEKTLYVCTGNMQWDVYCNSLKNANNLLVHLSRNGYINRGLFTKMNTIQLS